MTDPNTTGAATKEGFFSRWGRRITSLRNFILNAGFLLLLVFAIGAIFSTPGEPEIEPDSALFIAPMGTLVEQVTPPSDWRDLIFRTSDAGLIETNDLLQSIDIAAKDPRITTIVLQLDSLGGLTSSRAIRIGERLQAFRDAGKVVLAYSEYSGQFQYLAASYADQVYLHPMGGIMLSGLGGDRLYFADMLEKLKVKMHIFRVGEYKSATEPFSRNSMSESSRRDSQRLVDGIWQTLTQTIADNRGITTDELRTFSNDYDQLLAAADGDNAATTLNSGIVDGLMTKSEFRDHVGQRVGWQDSQLNGIDFQYYLMRQGVSPLGSTETGEPIVGVLTVQGAIVEAAGAGSDMASADALVDQIRMVKDDERVRALVLRVNSPGGSAFASELIREELENLQQAGKPVVASFGNIAASGGYWIAANADAIYAEPTSVTGSIGIFGVVPNFSRSLDAIGIRADGVASAPLARGLSVVSELSTQAKDIIQLGVEHGYSEFIDLVADGRGMSKADVEAVAQGRVWSGLSAKEIGLVDTIGSVDEAIARAAELAALSSWQAEEVRPPMNPRSLIMMQLMQSVMPLPLEADSWLNQLSSQLPWLTQLNTDLQQLTAFNDPRHVYALCLTCRDL
jgi:protease-4